MRCLCKVAGELVVVAIGATVGLAMAMAMLGEVRRWRAEL